MRGWMKDKEHLVRMASVFALGVGAFLVLQQACVPAGFGRYGHYRAGALDDNRDLARHPIRHAGGAACAECHSDVVAARAGSRHERIGCEACHGPLMNHASDQGGAKPPRPDTRDLCIRCHSSSASKPRGFPQVRVADHAGAEPCTSCHKAHSPRIS